MLALVRNSTFIKLVSPGGWFDVPGVGTASPAKLGWADSGYSLIEVLPAAEPPARKRRVGSPAYTVSGGVCTESYQLEDIPVTRDEVIAERERRLALGFDYDFGDARGVHRIGTTPADMNGWGEVTQVSQAAVLAGNPTVTIDIITETGPATVTATEWQAILLAAGQHRQPIWAASFVLQAMDPIPADFDDDSRWP